MPISSKRTRRKVAIKKPDIKVVIEGFKFFLPGDKNKRVLQINKRLLKEYMTLFDHIDTPIWMGDKDGYTIYSNPKNCELTGYSLKEIVGIHEFDLWTEEGAKCVKEVNEKYRSLGVSSSYEAEILTKLGKIIPVRIVGTPLSNGGSLGVLTNLQSIKESEANLKRRVAELDLLYNVHGHTRMADSIKMVFANILQDLKNASQDPLHTHLTMVYDEHFYRSSIPRTELVRKIEAPITAKGRVRGVIELGYSKQAKFSENRLKDEQKLLNQVAMILSRHIQSRENLETNKQLTSLNELKDEFLAITSHELRSPLTNIRGYLSFLIDQASREHLPYEMKQYLMKAYNSSQTLNNLINNILDVSRVNTGRFDLHLTPVNVVYVLSSVVDQMELLASDNGISLEFINEISDDLVIRADEVRLGQVFRNVIGNSIKFSDSNTVIKIKIYIKKRTITIQVSDEGVGISRADIDKVFDKFIQATKVEKDFKGGAGLGLFICKEIMEHHGGGIGLKSKIGVGTTVTINLPIK